MKNPFESGHIKNYILFYVGIVVIMILFFIASTLFLDVEDVEKKVFNTQTTENNSSSVGIKVVKEEVFEPKFKLLDKAY